MNNKRFQITLLCLFMLLESCNTNPIKTNQGVFIADLASLEINSEEQLRKSDSWAQEIISSAIDKSIVEFHIEGDSIKGLISFVGNSSAFNSKLEVLNDSMTFKVDELNFTLVPNSKGLVLKTATASGIQMLKSDEKALSEKVITALANLSEKSSALNSIEEISVGEWSKEHFVDEFGDKTSKEFFSTYVFAQHEISSTINETVAIQCYIDQKKVFFQIENLENHFYDRAIGAIKIKFPSGEIQTVKSIFHKNSVYESSELKQSVVYNHLINSDQELKILIDLSSASEVAVDKYQFSLKKGNLLSILKEAEAPK